jgi:hypothetical protein
MKRTLMISKLLDSSLALMPNSRLTRRKLRDALLRHLRSDNGTWEITTLRSGAYLLYPRPLHGCELTSVLKLTFINNDPFRGFPGWIESLMKNGSLPYLSMTREGCTGITCAVVTWFRAKFLLLEALRLSESGTHSAS